MEEAQDEAIIASALQGRIYPVLSSNCTRTTLDY